MQLIRPYDEELLELLLMLEAAEKSGEGGWDKLAGKQAGGENQRGRDSVRGEGINMFNEVERKDRKKDIEVWPHQQMISNQVIYWRSPSSHLTSKQIKDTTSKDLAVPEEELMPGDHWIHRDFTPVVRTVRSIPIVDYLYFFPMIHTQFVNTL